MNEFPKSSGTLEFILGFPVQMDHFGAANIVHVVIKESWCNQSLNRFDLMLPVMVVPVGLRIHEVPDGFSYVVPHRWECLSHRSMGLDSLHLSTILANLEMRRADQALK